jgi:signal transduction histidine kinase/CheY-like chemotaxis protein
VVPENNAAELPALYTRVLEANRPLAKEVTFPAPDGTPHDWDFRLFPVTDAEGSRFVGGVALDVSHAKRLETQLRQSVKMEAVGKLAGGVAHDFNNMLGVVNGYIELVMSEVELPETARDYLLEALRAGERAARLTRQLLAFSRQQVVAPALMDLNQVLVELSAMLRRLIGEDVELIVRTCDEPVCVYADRGQIDQILLNLVVNARDAMPTGGQITVETAPVHLDESYVRRHFDLQPGWYVILAVSDTGCGMDRQTQERVFDPFFTTKPSGQGTGLGLSTVHGIVRQSGGDIHVYSEPGLGTTFKIYLPLIQEGSAAGAPAPVEVCRGEETVLLVEDEVQLRVLVRAMLEASGYQVLEAEDVHDAEALAGSHPEPIHLLLTDVVMPGLSGRELAARVAAARPEIRVLYMSGYTDDAVVRHGVLHGEAHFIQKPFTPAALSRKLRQVLG